MMKEQDNNRVLSRNGARTVTQQELDAVNGGVHTLSCTISLEPPFVKDGDAC